MSVPIIVCSRNHEDLEKFNHYTNPAAINNSPTVGKHGRRQQMIRRLPWSQFESIEYLQNVELQNLRMWRHLKIDRWINDRNFG